MSAMNGIGVHAYLVLLYQLLPENATFRSHGNYVYIYIYIYIYTYIIIMPIVQYNSVYANLSRTCAVF